MRENKEKYKQPQEYKVTDYGTGTGYPETEVNMDGVRVKGQMPAGTKQKVHADMRGYGAATKGRKYVKMA